MLSFFVVVGCVVAFVFVTSVAVLGLCPFYTWLFFYLYNGDIFAVNAVLFVAVHGSFDG